MLAKISDIKGLNLEKRHPVIKDVLYSVAVQHGETGGASLIYNALPLDINYFSDEEIINNIYEERSKIDKYFKHSTSNIKQGVYNRFQQEKLNALQELE